MTTTILLVSLSVVSIIAVLLGFFCRKYSIEENQSYLSLRSWGLLLLCAGYIVHTLGDVLSSGYGEVMELAVESVAHVIIFVSFIFFVISAQKILSKAKGYWLK